MSSVTLMSSDTLKSQKKNYYRIFDTSKGEAFVILRKLFTEIQILDVDEFILEYKYEPCISSIFVVSLGGSYDYLIDGVECIIHNGTLSRLGNLQIAELQSAYLNGTDVRLPAGKCIGMGFQCPMCSKANWATAPTQTIFCCTKCAYMFTK